MLAKLLQLSYGPTQGKDFKSGGSIWRVRGVGGVGGGGVESQLQLILCKAQKLTISSF
jgi:hypothetical protein